MNLLIVDADSKNSYAAEELSSCLGIADLTIWYLDDKKLAEEEYLLDAVTGVSGGFLRVILLTKASHGIMNYHKKMIRSNPTVNYWVITLSETLYAAEQQQILLEVSEIFQQQNKRYAVLFDDPITLKKTSAVLKEEIPEKKQCVLFFTHETSIVNHIVDALTINNPDWDILCNPKNADWVEKYADRILLFEEGLHNFKDLAKINNSERIFVWAEAEIGTVKYQKEKLVNHTSSLMEECGFSLTREEDHILCGFSQFELFYAEIESGAYSYTALKNNDAFVMWNEYGLPLLNKQYEDANMKFFLNEHCILKNFIEK